jgi:hypothetical protein
LDNVVLDAITKVHHRTGNVVTPMEFGAVPNDPTMDNTTPLFNAFNSGKVVDLGGHTYYFTTPIDANRVKGVMNGSLIGNTINFNSKDLILYNVAFDGNKNSCVTVWNDNVSVLFCKFKNVENTESVSYHLNFREGKDLRVIGCVFDGIKTAGTNALRSIRLDQTENTLIEKCVFQNMSGIEDGDYIHVYAIGQPTYTTIKDNFFYCDDCKSGIKVQSSDVSILNNKFICKAKSNRIYAMVRIQNGTRHTIENNYFYGGQSDAASYPATLLLCEYAGIVNVRRNFFDHAIASGYEATTGANIIKITECEQVKIEENDFLWNLMYRAIYMKQGTGRAPVIKNNRFRGRGCCVAFEESSGTFIFSENVVDLVSNGGYLSPVYSNGSATVNGNDITFDEASLITTKLNLICKGNVFRNNNVNTVIDVINVGTGSSFLRDNTYDGNVRYQVKGDPADLTMEAICDQATGTPLNITTMSNVKYLTSRYKCNTLDFGYNDPTFTPRPMQQFYSTQKKVLMLYVDGAWTSAAFN